jgi:hypothetical protein
VPEPKPAPAIPQQQKDKPPMGEKTKNFIIRSSQAIDTAGSEGDLTVWAHDNQADLTALKHDYPEQVVLLRNQYETKSKELKNG